MITWGKFFDLSKIFSQLHVLLFNKGNDCIKISLGNLYVDLGTKVFKVLSASLSEYKNSVLTSLTAY